MYMYEHIPELIKSGITSFKIEGRMRDIEFLLMVVNSYGDAIDRYIAIRWALTAKTERIRA